MRDGCLVLERIRLDVLCGMRRQEAVGAGYLKGLRGLLGCVKVIVRERDVPAIALGAALDLLQRVLSGDIV